MLIFEPDRSLNKQPKRLCLKDHRIGNASISDRTYLVLGGFGQSWHDESRRLTGFHCRTNIRKFGVCLVRSHFSSDDVAAMDRPGDVVSSP